MAVRVTRSGDPTLPGSVDYSTDDGSNPAVFVPCSTATQTTQNKARANHVRLGRSPLRQL